MLCKLLLIMHLCAWRNNAYRKEEKFVVHFCVVHDIHLKLECWGAKFHVKCIFAIYIYIYIYI